MPKSARKKSKGNTKIPFYVPPPVPEEEPYVDADHDTVNMAEGAPPPKPKTPRGKCSRKGYYRCKNMGRARLEWKHNEDTATIPVALPVDFKRSPTDNEKARQKLADICKDLTPANTPHPSTDTGRLIYRFDGKESNTDPLGPNHTSDYVRRFTNVLDLNAHQAILSAWKKVTTANAKRHDKKHHPGGRSRTTAYHFGVWRTRQNSYKVTQDSRKQNKKALKAVRTFNRQIQQYVSPVIFKLCHQYFANQLIRNVEARRVVLEDPALKPVLSKFPECDFGGAFFTIAVKEGSSEVPHLDWNDHPDSITWIVPIWDDEWEGGDLWVPQFETRIPIRSGEAVSLCTRNLIHCGTEITEGNRLVLTLFTDRALLDNALATSQAAPTV